MNTTQNTLIYKGFTAKIEFDVKEKALFGRVINSMDDILFMIHEGESVEQVMQETIDAHLEFCKETGKVAAKPYSGSFTVRTTPERHQKIAIVAAEKGVSIAKWVEEIVSIHLPA